jgi:putative membrane protein
MKLHHSIEAMLVAAFFSGGWVAGDDRKDDKPLTDASFVEKSITVGLLEVELGKYGSAVGQSPDVKRFADRMVRDHTAANEELKTIAAGIPVTVPDRLDDTHQKKADELKKLNGSEFDKAYMEQMVKDLEAAVELFKRAEKDVPNARLKDFAKTTLPTLEEHLKLAKEVKDRVK